MNKTVTEQQEELKDAVIKEDQHDTHREDLKPKGK